MDKIKKISKRFRILFQIIFYLTIPCVLWYWVVVRTPHDVFSMWGIVGESLSGYVTLNVLSRALGFIATLIPTGIMLYGLKQLIKLFKNYEAGKIFVFDNANYYYKLGYALLAWVIGGILYGGLLSFIITFQNKPGYRVIGLSLSNFDVVTLIASGIIILIAWVMKEACKISQEQDLMI